jgi:hypothetical protein
MKRVHATTSLEEAELVCIALRDAGIEPLLENRGSSFSAVEFPTAAVPLGVCVPDREAGRAAVVIQDALSARSAPVTEEERGFQRRVLESRRRWRWQWGLAFLLPMALLVAANGMAGGWRVAGLTAGLTLTFVALCLLPVLWARMRR